MLEYDYKIIYRRGKENVVVDTLSRIHERSSIFGLTTTIINCIQEILEVLQDENFKKKAQVLIGVESDPGYHLLWEHLYYQG